MGDGPVRILVAEDDPSVLELLASFLTDAGHEVVQARTADEARTAAHRGPPSLIFLNVDLDTRGVGLVLLDEFSRSDIPVVMCTAYGPHHWGGYPGAAAYLAKPFTWEELTALLHRFKIPAADQYLQQ